MTMVKCGPGKNNDKSKTRIPLSFMPGPLVRNDDAANNMLVATPDYATMV
jgi:hypothetical protein